MPGFITVHLVIMLHAAFTSKKHIATAVPIPLSIDYCERRIARMLDRAGIIIKQFCPGRFELRNGGKISFIQPTDPVMEVDAVVSAYNDDDIFEEE